ncbi:Coiled-coil domain-containing protein 87 [Physocladia obscura]|uniref:Coiled-coil domain-containing protein 87 n=1 Tax=Physocladia obscura TaxID=109957 RepID=A0AAD5XEU0_9FUNG|nr:Coiled-coil domain-containing protein 87 [Physocladia obscura]
MIELEGKELVVEHVTSDHQDLFNQQIQEFKDALDSVIHPIPKLEMPKISYKGQQTAMKQKLIRETENMTKRDTFQFTGSEFYSDRMKRSVALDAKKKDAMVLIDDMDSIIAKNSMQFQAGSAVLIGDGITSLENKSEDPLLQAHTASTTVIRPPRKGFAIEIARKDAGNSHVRYLPENSFKEIHLRGFDFSILDETVERLFITVARSMESRVSIRVPKGFINLLAEPASAVSEFGNDVDPKKIDVLDEKLSRYKEIEELYSEITRSLTSDHLETDESLQDQAGCPAAPYDAKMPLSNAYKGIITAFTKRTQTQQQQQQQQQESEESETDTRAFATPQIRLTTRKYTESGINADEFSRDRTAAMRKLVSSRYNTFKYNYGGYTPYKERKKKKKVVIFHAEDYLDYIRTRVCDFILDLLIDSEEEARSYQRALEEEANRKIEEEMQRKKQMEEDERKERKRRRTLYSRGKWNVGALTYMREIQQIDPEEHIRDLDLSDTDDDKSVDNDAVVQENFIDGNPANNFKSELPHINNNTSEKIAEAVDDTLNYSEVELAQVEASMKKPKIHKAKSDTDISVAQQELEELWVILKMPLDQKLDMAIKYGSRKFSNRVELAIKYWKQASEYILAREQLLREIEEFEKVSSNPERYFMKGYDGSSEARMKEAKIRDSHLSQLHGMEQKLGDIISMIKFELNETVTYQGSTMLLFLPCRNFNTQLTGIPYTEKMKSDYYDILQRHQKHQPLVPLDEIE